VKFRDYLNEVKPTKEQTKILKDLLKNTSDKIITSYMIGKDMFVKTQSREYKIDPEGKNLNEADKVAQAKIEVLRFKLKDIEANMIKAKKEKDKEKFKTLKQQALETKLAIVDLAKG
jgi:hypothetical protein